MDKIEILLARQSHSKKKNCRFFSTHFSTSPCNASAVAAARFSIDIYFNRNSFSNNTSYCLLNVSSISKCSLFNVHGTKKMRYSHTHSLFSSTLKISLSVYFVANVMYAAWWCNYTQKRKLKWLRCGFTLFFCSFSIFFTLFIYPPFCGFLFIFFA